MLRHQICIWFYLKSSVTLMTERAYMAPMISEATQPPGKLARAL